MKILITGGVGYIGSIVAQQLKQAGHQIVIYDHLQRNNPTRVRGMDLVVGDTTNLELLIKTLQEKNIEAVMHFAAYIEAGESMQNPGKYFYNNVHGSFQLLQAMIEAKVNKLVFSSTAAVYGNPESIPIKETDKKQPVNPYGESKLMVEKMLAWYGQIHNLRSIAIRYFNAAGATLDGSLGEAHNPETHLIPNIIKSVLQKKEFTLFGDDYDTPDGTCIRDYIHVLDLAKAHIVALEALVQGHKSDVYNAGTGQGFSNRQVVDMVEKVSGQKVNIKINPRRPGDANQLIADSAKLQKEFGWSPKYSDLETIVKTAWDWHSKLSDK
jgi:UDP-glucose 4-epimerase